MEKMDPCIMQMWSSTKKNTNDSKLRDIFFRVIDVLATHWMFLTCTEFCILITFIPYCGYVPL